LFIRKVYVLSIRQKGRQDFCVFITLYQVNSCDKLIQRENIDLT
jgi:hypothetical protein